MPLSSRYFFFLIFPFFLLFKLLIFNFDDKVATASPAAPSVSTVPQMDAKSKKDAALKKEDKKEGKKEEKKADDKKDKGGKKKEAAAPVAAAPADGD